MTREELNLPNMLSGLRLLAAPVMLVLAWQGLERPFVILLVLAFITDALDGMLARRWNQVTELGARLDSWGDLAIYITLICATYLLWSDLLFEHAWFVFPAIIGVLIVPTVNLIKFRALSAYHTWLTKLAAVCIFLGGFILLTGGPAWPFQTACVLTVMSTLEQVGITLYLPDKRSNVKSLWHVVRAGQRDRPSNPVND